MKKTRGRKKEKRYNTNFYIKKIKTADGTTEELKVHVLIDDIKKMFKGYISGISFSITELKKDDFYGISIFSANKEREVRISVCKEIIRTFGDLQMKREKDDVLTDNVSNTLLLKENERNAYETLSQLFKKDGIDIGEFFDQKKFVFIRFLQGDDSKIE